MRDGSAVRVAAEARARRRGMAREENDREDDDGEADHQPHLELSREDAARRRRAGRESAPRLVPVVLSFEAAMMPLPHRPTR